MAGGDDYQAKYRQLREITDPWGRLGSRQYLNGTWRIGHVPHIAPEGYLHHLLPPISNEDLETLQDVIGIDFPTRLCDLLSLHNGLELFDLLICIKGRRTSYRRSDFDAMMEQPFDMVLSNTLERPDSAPDELIFIGCLGDERQPVVMWPDGSISLWDTRTDSATASIYVDVFDLLVKEAQKAQLLFDSNGRRIDEASRLPN